MAKTIKKKAAPKKAAKKAAPKKAAKKAAPKKAAAKSASKAPKKKKSPNAAFMAAVTPSAALSEVVGSKPLPRTEIIKKIWEYIKKNNLQNPANKREILADAKLKPVFGGKAAVSMFEMNKHLAGHLK